MKLLALDQASRTSGWAVFEDGKLIAHGKIVATQNGTGDRLYYIRKQVMNLLDKYDIDEIVLEDIHLQETLGNNVATFKTLAEVFGVLQELFAENHLPHQAVLPSVWRKKLEIKGRERAIQKKNAQKYVVDKYNLTLDEDESDAICIGTYYILDGEESFDWS